MAYNTGQQKQRSTVLAGLDCGFAIKGVPNEDNFPEARFTASTTVVVGVGECVGMLRIPANTVVLGAELYWNDAAPNAIVAVGDPYSCARLLGPIHVGTARGIVSGYGAAFAMCSPWGLCGSLQKIGTEGDGCGIGYRYTCETDLVMTNLYSDANATMGGWQGSSAALGSQVSTAINAGTYHLVLHVKKATAVQ